MKNRSSCRTDAIERFALAQILNRWQCFIPHSLRLRWISLCRAYCVTAIFLFASLGMTEFAMAGSGKSEQGNALVSELNEYLIAQGVCGEHGVCINKFQIYREVSGQHIYISMHGQIDKTLAATATGFLVTRGLTITGGMPITLRVFEGPITQYLGFKAMVSKSQESIKLEIKK